MTTTRTPDFQETISSPSATFDEGLRFFAGKGMVNNALTKIIRRLNELGIDYAVIGAVALNQYGYRRFTEVIHLLLTKEGSSQRPRRCAGTHKGEGADLGFRDRTGCVGAGEVP